jgi:hypothetical protein
MSFLISPTFSLQQNWRRGQKLFCPEAGSKVWGKEGRGDGNNMYTFK